MKLVRRIKKHKKIVSITSIFVFLLLSFTLATTNETVNQTIKQATTQQAEPFTELYFEDHVNLPSLVQRDEEYSFSFTIDNQENQDKEYTYEVYAELGDTKEYIDKGTVSIKNQKDLTIKQKFIISDDFKRIKIVVNLLPENQSIAFWIQGEDEL